MLKVIDSLGVPKVILRYIMIGFLDLDTIKNLVLTVKKFNVLDDYSKELLMNATKGFGWNCKYGHINVAQLLYSLGGVNIRADDDSAFRWSCLNGHINVAQWLYSLGVDIHADNDYAFKHSPKHILDWLHTLKN